MNKASQTLQKSRQCISGKGADQSSTLINTNDTVADHDLVEHLVSVSEEEIPELLKNNPYKTQS